MAIIKYTKEAPIRYAYLNIFPDQFKTQKQKTSDTEVKNTMDYFANKAYAEYSKNRATFVKNYSLVKGILTPEDFYQEPETRSFADTLLADIGLPKYVQHYSIMTTPINELVGEISKRPDMFKMKAFDDQSKAEELQFKTETLQEFIIAKAKEKILQKTSEEGEELAEEDLQKMSLESVQEELDNYTSTAEKWSNHVLTAQKADFNMKEKSEDAFRDLIVSNHEYYHLFEDNSKLGFNIEVVNPKNVWNLTTADKKYTSDATGRNKGAYASGIISVMELSEIIETFPQITLEEINHLRSSNENYGINVRDSNLGNSRVDPGIDSITYDTYDPLALQTRMMIEGELNENYDELKDFLGVTSNVTSFGNKFVVVQSYHLSKKKIGKLVYLDEMENLQSMLVDEDYKSGTIPTQVSLTWGWVNQWYKGLKIGSDVYHMAPFKLLTYNPIIGTTHEAKNTESRSVVDLMKPFQVIYNIGMNQIYKLLEKEIGNVAVANVRRVPRVKDGDGSDDIDIWEMEAKERGILFDDDSPENTKAPVSNQSVLRNVDLTRSAEIQSRYNLVQQMKSECWELVGLSRQRMGSVSASETATGINTAMQQSYSQTEPLFVAHEYVLGQVYQAIVDAALYIESAKPQSTISYITGEGAAAFCQVNGRDLSLRDIKVFSTNRPEDTQMFNEIRSLSQAIIQNGGSVYDVVELYSTKSLRAMKKTFKDLRDQQLAQQQQAAEQKQQQLDQQKEQFDATMQQTQQIRQEENVREDYQKDMDRLNKKEIAIIQATGYGKVENEDINNNDVADVLEGSKLAAQNDKVNKDYSSKMADISSKNAQMNEKMKLEREKLQVDRDNQANDLAIAKENAKNRATKKK
jgi:hypothetical protein